MPKEEGKENRRAQKMWEIGTQVHLESKQDGTLHRVFI